MVYADYEYYTNTYYGTAIKEQDFPRLALRASSYINYYTQGRAAQKAELEAVKMCCCDLAEQYQVIEQAQALTNKSLAYSMESKGPEAASESVGSWSKSYRTGGESAAAYTAAADSSKQLLASIARQYLAGTGLLYRGGRCCCE